MNLNTKVSEISGIGPAYVKRLNKIGIFDVKDLIYHFPRRYDDFSNLVPISKARPGENVSVRGAIWQIASKRSRRGVSVLEVVIADETGTMKAVWFNQPFLKKTLKQGDEIVLAGKPEWNYGSIQMTSPSYEKVSKDLKHTGRLVPIYPETEGLTSKWLRFKIKPLLKYVNEIEEYLPEDFRKKYSLIDITKAIEELHFPTNAVNLEKANRRVDFEEMFFLQLAVVRKKRELEKEKAPKIIFDEVYIRDFTSRLGFVLTNAQKKAAFEIFKNMEKETPMNRLLEGDVGSGKTLVAAMALSMAAKNDFQSVIIAPTEILAKQHLEGLSQILNEFEMDLLAGSLKKTEKEKLLENIKKGKVKVIIGTHALFQERVKFKNLGLVIIDEQHRFGVEQRMVLRKENDGITPHFLSMSATPIPRTLTLTVYGDLDVSILDEFPAGRKPITTRLVEDYKRHEAYKFIDEKIEEGRQVFVICPMIEESDKLGVKSVIKEFERLKSEIFSHRKIAMLHGKMKADEKEKIMLAFSEGKIDILVATSVIEVGVNVPNASVMMIEGADRFGLAQLHQFRGRVGRGEHKSYCFLFSETSNEVTLKRLHSFVNLTDGFKLAEIDLEIRGPGEVFGKAQHGIPDIKTKNLMNIKLIKETRKAAEEFLASNNLANFPLLREKAEKYDIVKTLE